ncbi:MAG: IS1595 family transposase [Sphingomicrobium sp.]
MFDLTNPIFFDADKAREHLEAINWPEGPFCPHCGECENVTRLNGKSHRKGLIQCNSCAKNFTVTVGTVFERSKIGLNKWMLATYLLASSKKGFSAHQLHRTLGVTYKTAWFMMHRIREAMKDHSAPLGGPGMIVEADEAFVGGKKRNRLSGKVAPKKKVVALIERGGRARSFHVANIHGNTVRSALVTNIDRASTLMTDEASVYRLVGKEFARHGHVLHAGHTYAKGDIHSNSAENFFSILKRGVIGTYHHWSAVHMHRYLVEFDFRYSTKNDTDKERSDAMLRGIVGKRLTYRRPHKLAA